MPALPALGVALSFVFAGSLLASGQTDLQQTLTLLWVMIGLSVAGSIITFGFLIYALWKYRDPRVKGRRYG
jgi:heme/copper-type cytochrome/quinol oxidase subunit 2